MVNGVVANKWQSITGNLISGSTGQFVKTPPLKDLLEALTNKCANNSGLLAATGYTNVLDVEGLVQSKPVQDGIESGKR